MNIIEQIKAEIERLKEHTVRCGYPGQDESHKNLSKNIQPKRLTTPKSSIVSTKARR